MYYQVEDTNLRIAGSMHLVPRDHPNLPGWVEEAFNWAEELTFETDIRNILPFLQRTDGSTLRDSLPPNLAHALFELVPKADIARWETFKLGIAVTALVSLLTPMVEGVEPQMLQRATKHHRELSFLETQCEHGRLFEAVPEAEYLALMSVVLNDRAHAKKQFVELYEAWIGSRIENVEAVMMRAPLRRSPVVYQKMLLDRNRDWMPALLRKAQSSRRTLVAVGAGHLSGQGGILDLLKEAGCSVTPILPAAA
ncbi:MAG: TraB/GumN family protein [Alphaproteobacteria bacterium]|nr:TraB/GumN family protein [Alphaproteobacteria bacterium]